MLTSRSDMLAEYHLPRSGIELVVERILYPNAATYSTEDYLIWVSNLSARRLMNRVHFTTYTSYGNGSKTNYSVDQIFDRFTESSGASSVLFTTSAELYSQLQQWWNLLPAFIKPHIDDVNPTFQGGILLLRFWACGDIIYRPFLYKVCSMDTDSAMLDSLIEPAMKCVIHCRKFLEVANSVTKVPSAFTMINLHS